MATPPDEVQRLEARLRVLTDATRVFAELTTAPERLIETVARRLAEVVQDSCSVSLLSDDGTTLVPVANYDCDPEALARFRAVLRIEPVLIDGHPVAEQVCRTGESYLEAEVDLTRFRPPRTTERYASFVNQIGLRSLLIVALRAHNQTLGLLTLMRHGDASRRYDEHDRSLAQGLADHAALAILNSRLYRAERIARAEAENAREALRASEASHRLLFEASPAAMFVIAVDSLRILAANEQAQALYGYRLEELLKRSWSDLEDNKETTHGTDIHPGPTAHRTRHRRSDGSIAHIAYRWRPFQFHGQGARLVVVGDVTDRVSAEEGRKRAEARMARLTEAGIIGIVSTDRDGRVLEVNDVVLEMLGYSRAELLAPEFRWHALTPPDWRDQDERNLAQMQAHDVVRARRKEYFRKDGSRVPVLSGGAFIEETHEYIGFVLDMTERAEAQAAAAQLRAIQASESMFRGLLESAPDAMIMVDPSGRIVLVNAQAERLFAYARDELIGQPIEILVPERLRAKHPGHRSEYFRASKSRPMGAGLDLHAVRGNGTEFPAEISLSPLETPQGRFVTAAIRDITDQKRRQHEELRRKSDELEAENRRMQEANRLKSEFMANMSHELRTPLNAIIGFTELMVRGKVGPVSEPHKEYLGDILTSSRHLLQLINDVLDLAKVESGKHEFHPQELDLGRVVGEVRDILRGLAAGKRIRLETAIDPGVTTVVADPGKLKQVLYNYISNALKFTGEDGRVSIRVVPDEPGRFRIEVEDTGIGIRPEDLSRLFVEFQQLDSGVAKRYPGTGLGLALTKRIVEAQNGSVGVRSRPGLGSTFWAALPRDGAQPVEATDLPARGSYILLIDADAEAARHFDRELRPLGREIRCVTSTVEALRLVERAEPALIVIDPLGLEIDSHAFLETIRSTPLLCEVPIVLWSAQATVENERTRLRPWLRAGVLKTPGRLEILVATVRGQLTSAGTSSPSQ